ncbi:MAG: hypothetical protein JKY65_23400, partial [Planctomycetes bacterium]|nr:hypothetical protein [Planctomycetota bacterium]
MIELSDPDDPRLAAFHTLRERRASRGSGAGRPSQFIAESELAVGRLLASDWRVDSLLVTRPRAARLVASPGFLRREHPPQVFVGERAFLSQVVGFDFHRGCAAAGPRPPAVAPPAWERAV